MAARRLGGKQAKRLGHHAAVGNAPARSSRDDALQRVRCCTGKFDSDLVIYQRGALQVTGYHLDSVARRSSQRASSKYGMSTSLSRLWSLSDDRCFLWRERPEMG